MQFEKPDFRKLPRLAHDLDRVLFSPGVHYLQDSRSKVFNFDPWLQKVPPNDAFDFDKLQPFIKPSKDKTLHSKAKKNNSKYVGSTSSMTHILSHIFFLVSMWRPLDITPLSQRFMKLPDSHTRGMRVPASVYLRYNKGVYAIDADKSFDVEDSILMILGKSMERFLTLRQPHFERLLKKSKDSSKVNMAEEQYSYASYNRFLLRSQLDCYDKRLPLKSFDLKSRATIAIRLLRDEFDSATEYRIKYPSGLIESFEREYFDMMRSAFLKYNFQARIGNMDGVFVAFHNTKSLFGFQYIPREEMDKVLFGSTRRGDKYFFLTLQLLEKVFDTVTAKYPAQVRL
ncbi:mitochondrial protein Pet127-domain-containing protein [Dimargaris cristalligena]|uniref:Mitochondrial protein Pet127-domain-containing protein n=1 Tax=Dimargaris cristalligena TaxID=215637 RepID=A0A4P9ZSH7_9FUNG|nr:mitochondrial protein Pet127-domain-containing protein [Dimargaris cristalligena]|eukprot:RKP36148.1 mitochondrial protein Pet127-domain-containing protein [Dimargaris cristalligena]